MLILGEGEKILTVMRKHWFVMLRTVITIMVLLLLPPVVLTVLPLAHFGVEQVLVEQVTNFVLSLYVMVLILFLFLFWMDYFLDMWIVTTERIIDVTQEGLFNRTISEIPLSHIQDITIEVRGIIETFLKFGTMRIQTAGEREFLIEDTPYLYETKDIIVAELRKKQPTKESRDQEAKPHE